MSDETVMPIKVYRNLNRPDIQWSISYKERVIAYRKIVALGGVKFKHATPKQREHIITEHRQVFQWLRGTWFPEDTAAGLAAQRLNGNDPSARQLGCDPKKGDGFRDLETNTKVDAAQMVLLTPDGVFFWPHREWVCAECGRPFVIVEDLHYHLNNDGTPDYAADIDHVACGQQEIIFDREPIEHHFEEKMLT